MAKKFYIKERRNPQTGTYYTLRGQLNKKTNGTYKTNP